MNIVISTEAASVNLLSALDQQRNSKRQTDQGSNLQCILLDCLQALNACSPVQVAVAYSILEFQQQPENSPMSSYIWDISNPNTPDFELTPQSQLTSINFNLKDTSLVGAGQYNGQFAYFDMRKGSTPVEASPIEHSHR